MRVTYNHHMRRSRCFVFDQSFEFARFYYVKTKAFSYAFYVYVSCPTFPPKGLSARAMTLQIYDLFLKKEKICKEILLSAKKWRTTIEK